ncbi:MAG: histidine kinase [Flavipsychrobacter sp.]|nr:histidine kinase [Flavipsychrobacter sp.]
MLSILIDNIIYAQINAQKYFDSLTYVIPKISNTEQKVIALDTIGLYYKDAKPDTALFFAKQGLQLAVNSKYIYGEAKVRSLLSLIYSRFSEYENANVQARLELQLFTKINSTPGIAAAYNQLGVNSAKLGRYDSATIYLFKSEKIYENAKDSNALALVYMNLGVIAEEDGRQDASLDEALQYFTKALSYSKNDLERKLELFNNIGVIYGKKGDLKKALSFFKNVLDSTEVTFLPVRINALTDCVMAYDHLGDHEMAIKCTDEGLFLARKYNLPADEALCLMDKGAIISGKNITAGTALIHQGLDLAKKIGNKRLQLQGYDNLMGVYEDNKDYKNAYLILQEKNDFATQVFNIEKAKKIAQVRELYETEKKDNEILLLNKDRSLQALQLKNEKTSRNYLFAGILLLASFSTVTVYNRNRRRKLIFQKQISETEMTALRAQMNPHFLFNSLNSIHSYIQDNNNAVASAYLLDFSKLTRIILENSLHQSIPLAEELQALDLYMSLEARRMDKKLNYEIAVSPDIDSENTLIPPLILQPFIENAILHGLQHKKDSGNIKLTIALQDNMLHCTIEDNGIGREKASQLKGKFASKKESLGMKLTNQRIDIINKQKKSAAYVTITDITDNGQTGVRVILTLPLETRF